MLKKNLLPLVLIILCGALIGGYLAWQNSENQEDEIADITISSEDMVKQGMTNLAEAKTGSANFQFDLNSMPLAESSGFRASMAGTLNFDSRVEDKPLSLLSADVTLDTPEGSVSYDNLALLKSARSVYLSLSNLSLASETETALGQSNVENEQLWYQINQDTRASTHLPYLSSFGEIIPNLDQGIDVVRLQQALMGKSLFNNLSQLADTTVNNVDTYHFAFDGLNPESTTVLLSQLNASVPLDETAVAELQRELEKTNMTGEIWISKTEGTIQRLKIDYLWTSPDEKEIALDLVINLSDINQPVTIIEPEDSTSFESLIELLPSNADRTAPDLDELNEGDTLPELN